MAEKKKLYRSEDDVVLTGVCGGIAEEYGYDPTLVRVLTLLVVLSTGFGLFVYIAAALMMPKKSEIEG
jgi:phage shock protein C